MTPITFGSVCSGIGGMDKGFEDAGMRCLWQIEFDKAARSVLRRHFPHVKLYEDLTRTDEYELEPVDVLGGGTPCVGFSIAGLRGGLADDRSNLCFDFCRLADRLQPDVVWWENVPGALSMPDNAFGCFLAALVGSDAPLVHPDTEHYEDWWREIESAESGTFRYPVWPRAGMVVGPRRTAAWRILDSQFTGVAQRRERLFVVASAGAGCAAKILFEPEMLRRHSPPSRTARQDVAATLGSGPPGSGPRGDYERMTFVPETAKPCGAHALSKGRGTDLDNTTYVPEISHTVTAKWKDMSGGPAGDECQNLVAPPRGVVVVDDTQVTSKANRSNPKEGDPCHPLTESGRAPLAVIGFDKSQSPPAAEVSPALKAESDGDLRQCVAVSFQRRFARNGRGAPETEVVATLAGAEAGATSDMRPCVPHTDPGVPFMLHSQNSSAMQKEGDGSAGKEAEVARNLDTTGGFTAGQGGNVVARRHQVRRLTPQECEILQGFPNFWTLHGVKEDGTVYEQKDSPRYRQIGNAITVTVSRWFGFRIIKHGFPTQ